MIIKSYELKKNKSILQKNNFYLLYGENFGLKKDIKDIDIFDSYEHVIHYTLSSFIKMASANGFKIVKTIAPKPINTPVWHKFVGQYYQYPSPWILDWKKVFLRKIFHMIGRIEILIGSQINFQPDLMVILKKNGEK